MTQVTQILKSFLDDSSKTPAIEVSLTTSPQTNPSRETVKILVIGSSTGVNNIIYTLYRLGFAEVSEWSSLQPTPNHGEVMSILIRHLNTR